MTEPTGQAQPLPPPERLGAGQRVGHVLLIAAGWLLFAWSWHRVTAASPEVGELRWLMATALLVVPVLTLAWVAHNVGIHRRKGPRRSVTAVTTQHRVDFNGRRIEADWSGLQAARQIDIVVDAESKRFVAHAVAVRRPLPVAASRSGGPVVEPT